MLIHVTLRSYPNQDNSHTPDQLLHIRDNSVSQRITAVSTSHSVPEYDTSQHSHPRLIHSTPVSAWAPNRFEMDHTFHIPVYFPENSKTINQSINTHAPVTRCRRKRKSTYSMALGVGEWTFWRGNKQVFHFWKTKQTNWLIYKTNYFNNNINYFES